MPKLGQIDPKPSGFDLKIFTRGTCFKQPSGRGLLKKRAPQVVGGRYVEALDIGLQIHLQEESDVKSKKKN